MTTEAGINAEKTMFVNHHNDNSVDLDAATLATLGLTCYKFRIQTPEKVLGATCVTGVVKLSVV